MSLVTELATELVAPTTFLHLVEQAIPEHPFYDAMLDIGTYGGAALEAVNTEIAANQTALAELQAAVQTAQSMGIDPSLMGPINTALAKFTNGTALTFLQSLQAGLDTAAQTKAGSSVLNFLVNEFLSLSTTQAATNPAPQTVTGRTVAFVTSEAGQQAQSAIQSAQAQLAAAQAALDAANAAAEAAANPDNTDPTAPFTPQ